MTVKVIDSEVLSRTSLAYSLRPDAQTSRQSIVNAPVENETYSRFKDAYIEDYTNNQARFIEQGHTRGSESEMTYQ